MVPNPSLPGEDVDGRFGSAAPPLDSSLSPPIDELGSVKILIVDDRPSNIRVLGPILKNHGYTVFVADNGLKAIEITKRVDPDLVLLDVMMPPPNGFETCERIKADPSTSEIPIVFLSAREADADILRGFQAGGVDYVTKPFNTAILLARIRTHITLRRQKALLRSLAETDGLTMLANRHRFNDALARGWRRAQREREPIALILLDVDHFKDYNDSYGHLDGDEVLKALAGVLRRAAQRPGDVAARFGGEEFAVVLENTDLAGAAAVAEKLKSRIAALGIPHRSSGCASIVTVSAGVSASAPSPGDQVTPLIDHADRRLYRAKALGRNRICTED